MRKWTNEGGVIFPAPTGTVLLDSPTGGVFEVTKSPNPLDGRLGLRKIAEKFEFPFKIYDLNCSKVMKRISNTWNNSTYIAANKNLGVIFNGLKGTGKTIAAKLLSNSLNMPCVIVPEAIEGIAEFLQSLDFECVVIIDEAEKTFSGDSSAILLRTLDGVYNSARKLYILTTNNLYIDDNLISRPGRIRYIHEFGNLSEEALIDYLDDNVPTPEDRDEVMGVINSLEMTTIDILKSLVEEQAIHGELTTKSLNLPRQRPIFTGGLVVRAKTYEDVLEIKNKIQECLDEAGFSITQIPKLLSSKISKEKLIEEKLNPESISDYYDYFYEIFGGNNVYTSIDFKTECDFLMKGTVTENFLGEIISDTTNTDYIVTEGNSGLYLVAISSKTSPQKRYMRGKRDFIL